MRICFEQLTFCYASAQPSERPALNNIDLEFDTDLMIGICGVPGSGKSTFIRQINGIFKPTSGQVLIDGQNIHQSKSVLRRVRKRIGMSFQFPERQFYGRTVWEELKLSLEQCGIDGRVAEHTIFSVCEQLDFDIQGLRRRSPFTLSRGEQRKLGIALVLALQPDLLLLDEPSVGMDRARAHAFMDVLKNVRQQTHTQLVLVSHDVELLLKYAEHIIILDQGEVAFNGSTSDLLKNPDPLQEIGIPLPLLLQTLQLLRQKKPHFSCQRLSAHEALREIQRVFS
ncbi:hypothetical protein CSB45_11065 [candidate division KSB3 bacterium]|uniref:ABC transporter domain-containing protein n=1 Tax=candidate division KSB3 bacterium TaxID=2044937 RepID=A0A2G6E442_9BACT|nr:MAG: hypothetical protein CSB45_11065 [candidate division KSB3 bacterium]PIE29050.1 MAG: hypothetical protein CSA57_10540 [candidate division KSB3 bacterium]